MPLNLDEVEEPRFDVTFNKAVRSYDPWKVSQRLENLDLTSPKMSTQADEIRKAFEFPTAEEATEDKPTISVNQALTLMSALLEFMKDLPALKKLSGLMQNFSGSSQA